MTDEFIKRSKSIIIACDVNLPLFELILEETKDIQEIGAYKIGFKLGLIEGFKNIAKYREKTDKPFIYDHEKGGTTLPFHAKEFADVCKIGNMDAAIIFPFTGPDTLDEFVEALRKEKIEVIVGAHLTKNNFLQKEGGYISDSGPERIYSRAAKLGVKHYVMPGNKALKIIYYRNEILKKLKEPPILYCPGFGIQGGRLSSSMIKNHDLHFIIGRSIYNKPDIKKAVMEYILELKNPSFND